MWEGQTHSRLSKHLYRCPNPHLHRNPSATSPFSPPHSLMFSFPAHVSQRARRGDLLIVDLGLELSRHVGGEFIEKFIARALLDLRDAGAEFGPFFADG